MRRKSRQAFMGGAFSFPEAVWTRRTRTLGWPRHWATHGTAAAASPGGRPGEASALGLFLAAIRETFEEAACSWPATKQGSRSLRSGPRRWRLPQRTPRQGHSPRHGTLAQREGGSGSPRTSWSHRLRPLGSPRRRKPRRFAPTRFFLALLPSGQQACLTEREIRRIPLARPWRRPLAEHHAGPDRPDGPDPQGTLSGIVGLFPPCRGRWEADGGFKRASTAILPEIIRTADQVGIRPAQRSRIRGARRAPCRRPGETTVSSGQRICVPSPVNGRAAGPETRRSFFIPGAPALGRAPSSLDRADLPSALLAARIAPARRQRAMGTRKGEQLT
jgi:hypothetical protein